MTYKLQSDKNLTMITSPSKIRFKSIYYLFLEKILNRDAVWVQTADGVLFWKLTKQSIDPFSDTISNCVVINKQVILLLPNGKAYGNIIPHSTLGNLTHKWRYISKSKHAEWLLKYS